MALSAIRTELAVVYVVVAVTIRTLTSQACLRAERAAVTAFANHRGMRPEKREVGPLVVIEMPLLPVDRVVAGRAGLAESSVMIVIVPVAVDALFGSISEDMGIVTVGALGVGMLSEEGKAGQAVVEKDLVFPCAFAMAIRAGNALRAFVRVVIFVARDTGTFQFDIEYRLNMAGIALDRAVGTEQRMTRVLAVIEVNHLPGLARVAARAVCSVMAVVIVVVEMAAHTARLESVGKRFIAMAFVTDELGVLAEKFEVGVARVVEAGIVPALRRMAVLALVAASTIVLVILCVTAEARGLRVLECWVRVAVPTRRLLVFTNE